MRILITTDTFHPMVNGVVISTCNLYTQLKNRGHDVKILTLSSTGEERVEGDIFYLKSFKMDIYPGSRAKVPFSNKLVNEIIKWKPDIVHSQTEFSTMFIGKNIARKVHAPHIHTYHTMYEDYLKYIWKGKLISKGMASSITRLLLNSLDGIIVPTKKVKNALMSYGINKDMYIIPTGIDIDRFKRKITEKERESLLSKYDLTGKNVLIYIGRIAEEKNIQEVIAYFAPMAKKNNNIELLIVGDGPYAESLKRLVCDLELQSRVKFTGLIKPEEVYKFYQIGQAFITSSTSETQGLTYIEALASGIPVICRYDTCIDDLIINGENGFTFNNEEEFEQSVNSLISSNETVKKLSINAVKKAEEYSCEAFGEKMSQLYMNIIFNYNYVKWQTKVMAGLRIWH